MSNSIDREQPETNHADLHGPAAVDRIKSTVKQSDTCFFCTRVSSGGADSARPMSVQRVDDNGDLWFLSAVDSHKNADITRDDAVTLYFQGSKHSDFLQLTGTATVTQDKAVIRELWEPIVKTWFTQGIDDPRITAIRVRPSSGYYWDNKHGNVVAGVKMLIGAAIGKTLDDSIQGRVAP